ncbi:MAG TPA: DUF6152 family protein [Vicinamibacterales bacterium]|nr:DUF6152 family protein [Vicinamibacterales bacterium]
MRPAFAITMLAVVIASGIPAMAHHSEALYFDMTKAITLEGLILRVQWINPHSLIFLQSKNEQGELETWTIQGVGGVVVARKPELKERVKAGIWVAARVFPPRNPLYLDDTQTVLLTRPDDPKTSSRIVGGGQIRFSNGDVLAFGGGPKF